MLGMESEKEWVELMAFELEMDLALHLDLKMVQEW